MAGSQVELFDDLDRVAADAGGALDRAAQGMLYDRLAWWRLTADHIQGVRPRILRARTPAGTLWLPLSGDRPLEPLGSWYTLRYAPVFAGDPAVRSALLAEAARFLRSHGSTLRLWPLSPSDTALLADAFRGAGWRVRSGETSANWRADTREGWSAYWRARPSRLRHTVARRGRDAPFRFAVHTQWRETLWSAFEEVFASSWKPPEGAPGFLRRMAQAEAPAGTLRLATACRADRVIAVQLWLLEGGTATLHKLAHRRDEDAMSPGTLLTAWTIETLLREGATRLDFGTGDDRYKADWADQRTPLMTFEAANPLTPAGAMAAARWRVRALVRPSRVP